MRLYKAISIFSAFLSVFIILCIVFSDYTPEQIAQEGSLSPVLTKPLISTPVVPHFMPDAAANPPSRTGGCLRPDAYKPLQYRLAHPESTK